MTMTRQLTKTNMNLTMTKDRFKGQKSGNLRVNDNECKITDITANPCQCQECEFGVPVYPLYQEVSLWSQDHFHQWQTDHRGRCICRLHIYTAKRSTNVTQVTMVYVNISDTILQPHLPPPEISEFACK